MSEAGAQATALSTVWQRRPPAAARCKSRHQLAKPVTPTQLTCASWAWVQDCAQGACSPHYGPVPPQDKEQAKQGPRNGLSLCSRRIYHVDMSCTGARCRSSRRSVGRRSVGAIGICHSPARAGSMDRTAHNALGRAPQSCRPHSLQCRLCTSVVDSEHTQISCRTRERNRVLCTSHSEQVALVHALGTYKSTYQLLHAEAEVQMRQPSAHGAHCRPAVRK